MVQGPARGRGEDAGLRLGPAGFRDELAAPQPDTVDRRVTDLQAALEVNGVTGPLIMVGHSMGAYESLLLKDREPGKVVGMVLVDPAYPDQTQAMKRTTPDTYAFAVSRPPDRSPMTRPAPPASRPGPSGAASPTPRGA